MNDNRIYQNEKYSISDRRMASKFLPSLDISISAKSNISASRKKLKLPAVTGVSSLRVIDLGFSENWINVAGLLSERYDPVGFFSPLD